MWQQFVLTASDELRAFAMREMARALRESDDDIPMDVLERCMEYMDTRLNASGAAKPGDEELGASLTWFEVSEIDRDWAYERFLKAAELSESVDPPLGFLEWLAQGAEASRA